jgi:AP-3 complex subunit mu
VNPLFAFAFLDSFLETLTEYLGEVTEASIKENFDIVYMVSCETAIVRTVDKLTALAHRGDAG